MGYKNKVVIILLSVIFFMTITSCSWFLEKDNQGDNIILFDNYVLRIPEGINSKSGVVLSLKTSETSYTTLTKNCVELFYDSTNVYVKSEVFGEKYKYLHFQKTEINDEIYVLSSEEFENIKSLCLKCRTKNFSKK